MAEADRFAEFNPDLRSIAVERAKSRVAVECQRRIDLAWPIDRRIDVLSGHVAIARRVQGMSSDAETMAATDARDFVCMMNDIALINSAATLLREGLDRGLIDPNRADITADSYWNVNSDDTKRRSRNPDDDDAADGASRER